MAYTTQARVEFLLGPTRTATLEDRDDDGSIDAGLFAALEARIANRVNGALGIRYSMPCAAITDPTPTPGQVSDLCDIGIAWLLYAHLLPTAKEGEYYRLQFEGEEGDTGQLGLYRDGEEVVVGLAEKGAGSGRGSVAHESIGTLAAGGTDTAGSRTAVWVVDQTRDQTRGI